MQSTEPSATIAGPAWSLPPRLLELQQPQQVAFPLLSSSQVQIWLLRTSKGAQSMQMTGNLKPELHGPRAVLTSSIPVALK